MQKAHGSPAVGFSFHQRTTYHEPLPTSYQLLTTHRPGCTGCGGGGAARGGGAVSGGGCGADQFGVWAGGGAGGPKVGGAGGPTNAPGRVRWASMASRTRMLASLSPNQATRTPTRVSGPSAGIFGCSTSR